MRIDHPNKVYYDKRRINKIYHQWLDASVRNEKLKRLLSKDTQNIIIKYLEDPDQYRYPGSFFDKIKVIERVQNFSFKKIARTDLPKQCEMLEKEKTELADRLSKLSAKHKKQHSQENKPVPPFVEDKNRWKEAHNLHVEAINQLKVAYDTQAGEIDGWKQKYTTRQQEASSLKDTITQEKRESDRLAPSTHDIHMALETTKKKILYARIFNLCISIVTGIGGCTSYILFKKKQKKTRRDISSSS